MHCNGKLIKIKQTCSKNAGSVILHKCFVVINWWFLYCIWRFLWLILAIWARWFLNQWGPGNVGAVQILHILSLSSAKPSDFILQSFNLKIVKKCGILISVYIPQDQSPKRTRIWINFIKFSKTVFDWVNLVSQCPHLEYIY